MTAMSPRDDQLGRELTALGQALQWPPTPPIAPEVRGSIVSAPRRHAIWDSARRALALAALAAILVLGLAAAIGIALGGLRIEFGGQPPGSALPPELVEERGFGQRTDLATATRHIGALLLPSEPALGAPDHVYYSAETTAVTLAWGTRPGLPADSRSGLSIVVTELRADIMPGTFIKLLHDDSILESTSVGGAPAYWVSGGDHYLYYLGPNDEPLELSLRLVGNALLWEQDDLTMRIEGAPTLEDARRIAESMQGRAAPSP
jgi:hypothetical protein